MTLRLLFGPVASEFADKNQRRPPSGSDCITFGTASDADIQIGPATPWRTVLQALPKQWQPDALLLYLPYTQVPEEIWNSDFPIVGWAADWNLLFHSYRMRLKQCDAILTDQGGLDVLERNGINNVMAFNLFACCQSFVDAIPKREKRDIDVLFVGNLHTAVQRERLPWLARLSQLGERYKVVIRTGTFGTEYREMLSRSRIVFNRSIRGECNLRTFEAVAAGALLFAEAENREIAKYFCDRREYVAYSSSNLESLIVHYLEHGVEREAMAEAAAMKLDDICFEVVWQQIQASLKQNWPRILEGARTRPRLDTKSSLIARTWESQSACQLAAGFLQDLQKATVPELSDSILLQSLGIAKALELKVQGKEEESLAAAIENFALAVQSNPANPLARLNLAEALLRGGQPAAAILHAREAVDLLQGVSELTDEMLMSPHFPTEFDTFRVEWERAAWFSDGNLAEEKSAKLKLLEWRLNLILGHLESDTSRYQLAIRRRPDLPDAYAALGQLLASEGKVEQAIQPLQTALEMNWMDVTSARALYQVLNSTGRHIERNQLIQQRRLVAQAAPQVVRSEAWFATPKTEPSFVSSPPSPSRGKGYESSRKYAVTINEKAYQIECPIEHEPKRMLNEIFVQQQYPPLPFLREAAVIIDVGADVGCATILFHSYYRQAEIFAFEPDPMKFHFLQANTSTMEKVTAFGYGLYNRDLTVDLLPGSAAETTNPIWQGSRDLSQSRNVYLRKASDVFTELAIDRVDILKIDTEGSEVLILRDLAATLAHTKAVLVGYHSERDRRAIDRMLAHRFLLLRDMSQGPDRGKLAYVAQA